MDSCSYPRTVEEMLEAGWYNKILRKLKKANLKDILNTPEEMTQDIFVQLMRSNYLSRYDPDYRPFDVYIYKVVENLIKKRGARENTKGGSMIVNHSSIENTVEDGTMEPNTVYLDQLDIPDNFESVEDVVYMNQLIEQTKDSLKSIKSKSTVEYNGEVVGKDSYTVFKYILEGKSVNEIADILQVSKQYVYVLIHKIREVKSMQEFYTLVTTSGY